MGTGPKFLVLFKELCWNAAKSGTSLGLMFCVGNTLSDTEVKHKEAFLFNLKLDCNPASTQISAAGENASHLHLPSNVIGPALAGLAQ